jgi:bacteriorhodopsin
MVPSLDSPSSSGLSTQCESDNTVSLLNLTIASIWGIADGGRLVGLDAEIIAYAVLDILAKPVFGFWLLFTHDSMAST